MDDLIKELFDCVYQWGRVGIKCDHKSPAFQHYILRILLEQVEELEKEAGTGDENGLVSTDVFYFCFRDLKERIKEVEVIECACDESGCKRFDFESADVGGHIEDCPCGHCHREVGKISPHIKPNK